MKKNENIYTSRYIQSLEDVYCHSRSAVTSEMGLSCCSASWPTRIIDGGKKVIYTATMTAMLLNNMAPQAWGGDVVSVLTIDSNQSLHGSSIDWEKDEYGQYYIHYRYVHNYGKEYDFTYSGNSNSGKVFDSVREGGSSYRAILNASSYQTLSGTAAKSAYASGTSVYNNASQCLNEYSVAYDTKIYSGGSQFISANTAYSTNTIIRTGGSQKITSGGTAYYTSVLSGGSQQVGTNNGSTSNHSGFAYNTIVSSKGFQGVYGKGSAIDTVVSSGGSQSLSGGGIASNAIILEGGIQYVREGSVNYSATVSGSQEVSNGGVDSSTTVYGSQTVSSGGSSISAIIYGTQSVHCGSTLFNTVYGEQHLSGSATEDPDNPGTYIYDYGVARNVTIDGGLQHVEEYGNVSSTIIQNGGVQIIDEGGFASNTVLTSGIQTVYGSADRVIISKYGTQYVSGNGEVSDIMLIGTQSALENAALYDTVIYDSGKQILNDTASAFGTQISSGGAQYINQDAIAFSTTIYSGANQYVSSFASETYLSGGTQNIYGTASTTTLYTGTVNVDSRGILSSAVINSGVLNVSGFNGTPRDFYQGSAIDVTLNNGATQNLSDWGYTRNVTVNSGAILNVAQNASAFNVTQNLSGTVNVVDIRVDATSVTGTNPIGRALSLNNGVASNFMLYAGTQNVHSDASAISTVLFGGTQNISDGGYASSTIIQSGSIQNVLSGGYSEDVKINLGQQIVEGVTSNVIIRNNGSQVISSGGSALDVTVSSGGLQFVSSGGSASDVTVSSCGLQVISLAGIASNNIISSGGLQYVNLGSAYDTNIDAGTQEVSGGIASNTTVNTKGTQNISLGTVSSTTINGGGTQNVFNGVVYDTLIQAAGKQNVYLGTVSATTINGGIQNISGGLVTDTTITAGNQIIENANVNSTVMTGGTQTVSSGGMVNNVDMGTGATQYIYEGGIVNSTNMTGGEERVYSSGVANNTEVSAGATQYVHSSGYASGAHIYDYGTQVVYGYGKVEHTILDDYALQTSNADAIIISNIRNTSTYIAGQNDVTAGQVSQYIINSDGIVNVSEGGIVNNDIVYLGGIENIYSGGLANSTTVSGGVQNVFFGGTASDTLVYSFGGVAGVQNVSGYTNNTNLYDSSVQNIYSQGVADNTQLFGAIQNISSGATANSTVIDKGFQNVFDGGVANVTILSSFSEQNISSGGVANSVIVSSGGIQNVLMSGTANSTIVDSGGVQNISSGVANINNIYLGGIQNVYSGGLANNNIISNTAVQNISGGTANSNTILSGGLQNVFSNGTANNTDILSDGQQNISSGGIANINNIHSGGIQNISSGGIANNNNVYSGGTQNIFDGGLANSNIIQSYAIQNVSSGGLASNTVVNKYGEQYVLSDGTAIDTTLAGGFQYVSNGAIASNTVIISNGVQTVLAGGSAVGTNLQNATQHVYGSASNTVIDTGNQYLYAGADATSTIINNGRQVISAGATADGTKITNGIQIINLGATATNTTITNGVQEILAGAVADGIKNSAGQVNLHTGAALNDYDGINGILNVKGTQTITGNVDLNNGVMNFDNGGTPSTITVTNLNATDAVISMGINFEDQTLPSDQLQIAGTYSGNTKLKVSNITDAANATTGTGIKAVDITGTSTGTFELIGGKWDDYGYVYRLLQDPGDPSYYLRTTGEFSDTFKTMANMPALNAVVARTGMNSLNKRMGELRDMNNPLSKEGIWVRSYYKNATVEDLLKTDISMFGVEAGYDWLFTPYEPTKLYAGVMVGYLQANSIKTTNSGDGSTNSGDGYAPSVGIYATLANENGWFIDLAARNFWSKLDNTTHTASDTYLTFDTKRNLFTTSLEAGKTFVTDAGFKFEPKAELSYMNANGDSTKVTGGGILKYEAENYLSGKIALMFAYKAKMKNKLLIEPLLELAYNHEFNGSGKLTYGGAETTTSLKGGNFEGSVGLSMQLNEDLYWHALATYEKGSKLSAWGGNIGIRLAFGDKGGSMNKRPVKKQAYEYGTTPKEKKTTVNKTNKKKIDSEGRYTLK